MQCPACGYANIHEEACFCPQCRYQFQVPEDEPYPETYVPESPAPGKKRQAGDEKFTRKEIRQMKIQLLQSTLIVLLSMTLLLYTSSPRIHEMKIMISDIEFNSGGIISFLIASLVAWIFYRYMVRKVERA